MPPKKSSVQDLKYLLSLTNSANFRVYILIHKMGRPSGTQSQSQHGLNEDDKEKMISDAVFYFLVADQKKSIIKVRY